MPNPEITELQRIFSTRLDVLSHILDVAEAHFGGLESVLNERLAEDMLPLGSQVAFVCNQPRGFAQWCAGQPIQNLAREVDSVMKARLRRDGGRHGGGQSGTFSHSGKPDTPESAIGCRRNA